MILFIEFGLNNPPYLLDWNKPIDDFPHVIRKDGKKWEWVVYNKATGLIDYELKYSEIASYDPQYYAPATDWADIYPIRESKCECGAHHTSFPNGHMFYCKKYRKI